MPFVTLNRLTNAFKKAGATVEIQHSNNPNYGHGFAKLNDRVLEFSFQEGYPVEAKPKVTLIIARSPHTNIMTDCFCDTFFHSIKEAIQYITKQW